MKHFDHIDENSGYFNRINPEEMGAIQEQERAGATPVESHQIDWEEDRIVSNFKDHSGEYVENTGVLFADRYADINSTKTDEAAAENYSMPAMASYPPINMGMTMMNQTRVSKPPMKRRRAL